MQHPSVIIRQHLLGRIQITALDDPLLVVVELRLEMLLLGARLALHILLQHALVLLLLHLHLILHPLLAGDDVPRLIGIIGGVEWLRQDAQRQQRRQK
ncbi:hypothetical protein ATN83_0303 [Raoultella ornithinolytica]|nr:hypothetical protein ATN83_0303 [Raoultella ornithinolytica]AOO58600.1 hypothetical protein AN237_19575 [Raoultella ornithinolytica]KDX09689.1 hypothetical protein AB28_4787 [Raoultella ornithinolytica 2-156-04_S1_C2]BDA52677.1 hypothetical protein NUITMVR1_03360 [Raoultella ornithinolytica]